MFFDIIYRCFGSTVSVNRFENKRASIRGYYGNYKSLDHCLCHVLQNQDGGRLTTKVRGLSWFLMVNMRDL